LHQLWLLFWSSSGSFSFKNLLKIAFVPSLSV
jgi:hypothetical protein